MRITRTLFYLLLILLPTQLGRHFFFNFSQIGGIYIDYLIPTLYLTDVIIILFLLFYFVVIPTKGVADGTPAWRNLSLRHLIDMRKSFISNKSKDPSTSLGMTLILFITILYLIFNSLFISTNKWVALYKLIKILEMGLLGFTIVKIKPQIKKTILCLSIGVVYSSIIAVWQFISQRSIGGLWYLLGERTFSAGIPGIAAFSWRGELILRPYATFSHPNVLGGFLVLMIVLLFDLVLKNEKKGKNLLYKGTFILSIFTLFLTFSRLSWSAAGIGVMIVFLQNKFRLLLKINKKLFLISFYFLITFSVLLPLFIPLNNFQDKSLNERSVLMKKTIDLLTRNPFTGIGLNNSFIQTYNQNNHGWKLFLLQPVHNIFVLVFTETGIIGGLIFLMGIIGIFFQTLKKNPVMAIVMTEIIILGSFDHYFWTIQQGQLMLTVFTSLALLGNNS